MQWAKKFAKMEDLVLEFEIKSEESQAFMPFFVEVQDKLDSMATFKKTYQKFQLGVDTFLKKVAIMIRLDEHCSS